MINDPMPSNNKINQEFLEEFDLFFFVTFKYNPAIINAIGSSNCKYSFIL